VSAADPGLGGCSWRRCRQAATVVVSFQAPHLLAGTSRGYCEFHAAQAADQPGAVLTGAVGRVPVQPALPGIDGAAQAAPAVSLALAAGGAAWACRLFQADQDRCRLLAGVAVAVGVVLLNLGGLSRLVGAVGVPVVEFAHLAGWYLGPFALLGAAGYGSYRLARRWWNAYPDRGLGARTATVLGSLAVGVAVGVLVRAAPLLSEAAGIAQDATAAGVRATARTLLDRVGGAIGLT